MKDIWRLILSYKPYVSWMIVGILIACVVGIAGILLLSVSGWLLATMAYASLDNTVVSIILPAIILAVCAVIRTLGRYGERLITHQATFKFIAGLRSWFYERIEPLVPAAMPDIADGDVLSRLRGDIDAMERFYIGFVVPVIVALTVSILLALGFAYFDWSLSLILCVLFLTGGIILPYMIYKFSLPNEESLVNDTARMKTVASENLQAMGEILVYGHDGDRHTDFDYTVDALANRQKTSGLWMGAANTCMIPLLGVTTLAIFIAAYGLFLQGSISGAIVVLLIMATVAIGEVLALVPVSFGGLGRVKRSARRIFDLSDRSPKVGDPPLALALPHGFELEFKDVTFAYPDSHKPALCDLSFSLKSGQTMAVIGSTGSGKSTIISLLQRFYDPQDGEVLLNGHSIDYYDAVDIRSVFSVMGQRPYIFNTTIRENLMLANGAASEAELQEACRIAGLADFIESLPMGLDTDVGEHGKHLSGGQIKRLGLAQALLKPSRCLILDEPGEGLDYAMEREILDNVTANLGQRALILITHRQAGLNGMDITVNLDA